MPDICVVYIAISNILGKYIVLWKGRLKVDDIRDSKNHGGESVSSASNHSCGLSVSNTTGTRYNSDHYCGMNILYCNI